VRGTGSRMDRVMPATCVERVPSEKRATGGSSRLGRARDHVNPWVAAGAGREEGSVRGCMPTWATPHRGARGLRRGSSRARAQVTPTALAGATSTIHHSGRAPPFAGQSARLRLIVDPGRCYARAADVGGCRDRGGRAWSSRGRASSRRALATSPPSPPSPRAPRRSPLAHAAHASDATSGTVDMAWVCAPSFSVPPATPES